MAYRSQSRRRKQPRNAAIFVDYSNLIATFNQTLPAREIPEDHVFSLLPALRAFLRRKYRLQPTLCRAYGDFSTSDLDEGTILNALYASGADPRFVASLSEQDVPVRLALDAMETLLTQPEINTIVLVSGDLAYLPLLRQIHERGRQPLLATLTPPDVADDILLSRETSLLDLTPLLDDHARRSGGEARTESTYRPTRSAAIPFQRIDDPDALNTLEVIEEHFGQYDEVYLTPLLRKLSDIFDDAAYDPKSVISDLEAAGAVRLEKRHGNPYDYTVLIVMREHPDVQIVQRQYYENNYEQQDAEPPDEHGDAVAYPGSDGLFGATIASVDGQPFSMHHDGHKPDGYELDHEPDDAPADETDDAAEHHEAYSEEDGDTLGNEQ